MKKVISVLLALILILCAIPVSTAFAAGAPREGCNYVSTVITQASCESAGLAEYRCTDCGDSYTVAIPATGHVDTDNDEYCDNCGVGLESSEVLMFKRLMSIVYKLLDMAFLLASMALSEKLSDIEQFVDIFVSTADMTMA